MEGFDVYRELEKAVWNYQAGTIIMFRKPRVNGKATFSVASQTTGIEARHLMQHSFWLHDEQSTTGVEIAQKVQIKVGAYVCFWISANENGLHSNSIRLRPLTKMQLK
jgi:hypothetical protein